MSDVNPKYPLGWCLRCLPIALLVAVPAAGRDVTVGGGFSTSYEYYNRQYDKQVQQAESATAESSGDLPQKAEDDKYNRLRLAPLVTIASIAARDQLNLRYSPSVRYDDQADDHDIDHNLSAKYAYSLTPQWRLNLGESYVLTDQTEQDQTATTATPPTAAGTELSDNEGRRKYWKNDLSFSSDYRYWEDSLFTLGYALGRLKHTEVGTGSDYQDYYRHNATLAVSHRFDSIWRLSVNGNYSRGLFENAKETETAAGAGQTPVDDDLHEYRASTVLESRQAEHHLLSLKYGFTGVDYDDVNRDTTTLHDATAGWLWDLAKDTSLYLGAGPSYTKTEGQQGEWGYNAGLTLRYGREKSNWALSLDRGYDVENFTGTNESGLRKYWQSRLDFNHQLLQELSLKLFALYRYEDQEKVTEQRPVDSAEPATAESPAEELAIETETFNRKRLGAGSSLEYKFARWYAINLSYNYTTQDSEQIDDSYDEHRLVLSLSVERELFQW